jgi:hypothetical protein
VRRFPVRDPLPDFDEDLEMRQNVFGLLGRQAG